MNSYYSILYASINPVIQDKVSIGLILTGENAVYFDYSKEKLSYLNRLFPKSAYNLLKDALKNIELIVGETQKNEKINDLGLSFKSLKDKMFSQQYVAYLSRYNQNLLRFSEPKHIDIEPTREYFNTLFEKYIFKAHHEEKKKGIDINSIVKNKLFPRINERVNINKELTIEDIDTLVMPVNIDFIGKNGNPVAGKTINFESRNYDLKAHFNDIISLIQAFDVKNEQGKYYVIGNEPENTNSEQHKLWNHVRGLNYLDFVPINEIEKIAEYIENEDIHPWFD